MKEEEDRVESTEGVEMIKTHLENTLPDSPTSEIDGPFLAGSKRKYKVKYIILCEGGEP